jgi:hypothetical protein
VDEIGFATLAGRNVEWAQQGYETPEHYYDFMHYSGKEIFKYPEGLDNLQKAFKDRFP